MYKIYKLIILFLFLSATSVAQVKVSPHSKLMFQKTAFGFISELPRAAPETLGSSYYSEDWLIADLFLKGETLLEGAKVKLDLSSQNFDIFYEGEVKLLPGDKVLSFHWITKEGAQEGFVRGTYTTIEGLKLTGFLKLLSDTEPFKLVEFYATETISANYNPQLDVGNKDHQIVKKTRTFIAKDKLLLEVKGGKKKFINDFKDAFQTDVSGIIKELDIDIRDEDGLIALLKQLNYTNPG
jgi:hypothetical protein